MGGVECFFILWLIGCEVFPLSLQFGGVGFGEVFVEGWRLREGRLGLGGALLCHISVATESLSLVYSYLKSGTTKCCDGK